MATDVGLKNFDAAWVAKDGGTTSPSLTPTGATGTGSVQDLMDGVTSQLPDEVAIRLGVSHTTTSGTTSGAGIPSYRIFALWLTGTATGTPTAGDRESHLVLAAKETATVTGVTPPGAHVYSPTNTRIFACKGRYLKLRYQINAAGNKAGNVKYGANIAPIFGQIG